MCIDGNTNKMHNFDIITLDEQERHEAVINFIKNHPGCTLANIDKLQGQNRGKIPGRVKLSRILKYLKSEESDKIVFEIKLEGNKRDKRLFVKDNNPFVT